MSKDLTKKLEGQPNDRFDELFQMVQTIGAELSDLKVTVADLKQTVDVRLYDTRPIWEKVQADIAGLQEGQKSLVQGQQGLVEGQRRLEEGLEALRGEMRTGFRVFTRKISVLSDDVLEVRADYKDLAERVYKLETGSVTGNP